MIQLREARDKDYPDIWQIFHEVVKKGDTYVFDPKTGFDDAKKIWMGSGIITYVAENEQKEIVGTYIIKPNQPGLGSHVANASFMVHPQHHGKGIVKEMAKHSLDEAKRLGYRAMQFNIVISTNEPAIKLWEKMGFQIVGTIPQALHHSKLGYVDAFVMHRFL